MECVTVKNVSFQIAETWHGKNVRNLYKSEFCGLLLDDLCSPDPAISQVVVKNLLKFG
jgi:hypothetical protein